MRRASTYIRAPSAEMCTFDGWLGPTSACELAATTAEQVAHAAAEEVVEAGHVGAPFE